ncbi:MAG TPA: pyridoxal phosphate-dependent aminotransferase [Candidatus Marinimicrobia bacterium]|jgi:aspartate/methionine/tyrosine aminotransferase|nr:pyridoxal phosphate-dependent aminotransferase [Candidatus Neomarinimicrobiota bacterium]MDP7122292.1 pyridoxal phosphate-dependent aminotransferase [Candidatus Neomarinimicrobiota bacterium]MDP7483160.1 pyridoxal phosphate-dependent aminotransferase [Candidatus Neomarinimicrobiota bacterium]MDP7528395.1 pyridoxal phosphate-dependent aminotransferase [Candidatus Neomarinimicrobiota bacterium]MDP7715948.1 pyridoxal phosphate-dependent aminotransferase [Candidatus Neomarinimicrobiota bacterium|tara:strand:+ start:1589 stop:2749 length:1161 start_codon:yes stop_codon:yes gene_type:complete
MSVSRLEHITKIGVEVMGDLADKLSDPEVLRLENLDTDLRPPQSAVDFTKHAVDDDEANSYLPFFGLNPLRKAATALVERQSGQTYNWETECVIGAGGMSGILNVLLATLEPGDEVLLTDPIYVGLINRVRLAGGVPKFVPLIPSPEGWRLDMEALEKIAPEPVKVALLMSPAMPTGCVFTKDEWDALTNFCKLANCWLIDDTAMERILYNDQPVIHPASFSDMRDKVITCGAVTKEYRMIGWRVGWAVGPAEIMADVMRVSISNVVCQTGIAMGAAAAAIKDPDDGIETSVEEWKRRRDVALEELKDFDVIPPDGGWSFLVDVSPLDMDAPTASKRLLDKGKIAATPMVNWGNNNSSRYVRIVFSNEPVERLKGLGKRFKDSLFV